MPENFFTIHREDGILPDLAPGLTVRVFAGDHSAVPTIQLEPGAQGSRHAHPQEQWAVSIASSAVRHQRANAMAAGR